MLEYNGTIKISISVTIVTEIKILKNIKIALGIEAFSINKIENLGTIEITVCSINAKLEWIFKIRIGTYLIPLIDFKQITTSQTIMAFKILIVSKQTNC